MNGQIVSLTWNPGSTISSSKGANKYDIRRNMSNADFVKNNGFGNYKLIEYSKYDATIILDNNACIKQDVKRLIKDALCISKMTSKTRTNIENLLPINIDFTNKILTLTDDRLK